MNKKRLLLLCLIALIVAAIAVVAVACNFGGDTSPDTLGDLKFSLVEDAYYRASYNGQGPGETNIVIPATFKEKPVKEISDYGFRGIDSVVSVTIPASVTKINESAFYEMPDLKSVTIENASVEIKAHAFAKCPNLDTVNLGNAVTALDHSVFRDCTKLEGITLPESITSIGEDVFRGCTALTSIVLPNSVTDVASWLFQECTNLRSVTLGNAVTNIRPYAFFECSSLTSIVFPSTLQTIGGQAFRGCTSLISVTVNSDCTFTDGYEQQSFYDCERLIEVVNNSSLAIEAGSSEFGRIALHAMSVHEGESSLQKDEAGFLTIELDDVKYLLAYEGAAAEVTLPENVTVMAKAFADNKTITSVTILASVKTFGEDAFKGAENLTAVNYEGTIASWTEKSFANADANPLTYAGALTIEGEEVTDIVIPETVTAIGKNAFAGYVKAKSTRFEGTIAEWCAIDFETILSNPVMQSHNLYIGGERVREATLDCPIKPYVFAGCYDLNKVVLESNVGGITNIGDEAFRYCYKLVEVHDRQSGQTTNLVAGSAANGYVAAYAVNVAAWEPTIRTRIENVNDFIVYKNRSGSVNNYFVLDYVGTGDTVTVSVGDVDEDYVCIYDYAFYRSGFKSVTLADNVIKVGKYAFAESPLLTKVEVPLSATSIEPNAFDKCHALGGYEEDGGVYLGCADEHKIVLLAVNASATSVTVPASVVTVADRAFMGTTALKNLTFETEETLVAEVFDQKIYETTGVRAIGNEAFKGSGLKDVALPKTVTYVGKGIFQECASLESVTLPFIGSTVNAKDTDKEYFLPYYFGTEAFEGGSRTYQDGSYYYVPLTLTKLTVLAGSIYGNTLYANFGLKELYLGKMDFVAMNGGNGNGVSIVLDKYVLESCDELASLPEALSYELGTIGIFDASARKYNSESFTNVTYNEYENGQYLGNSENPYLALMTIKDKTVTSFTVHENAKFIASYAFENCTALTTVDLKNVKGIGNYAFANLESLTTITLPDELEYIGGDAFYHCTALTTDLIFADGLKSIGYYAFRGCSSITKLDIPGSTENVGYSAFEDCSELLDVRLHSGIAYINSCLFYSCDKIETALFGTIGKIESTNAIFGNPNYDMKTYFEYTLAEFDAKYQGIGGYNVYLYSETEPAEPEWSKVFQGPNYTSYPHGSFWHYDEEGNPTPWFEGF